MSNVSDARIKLVAKKLLEFGGAGRFLLIGSVDQRLVAELRSGCVQVDLLDEPNLTVPAGVGEGDRPSHDSVVLLCDDATECPAQSTVRLALAHAEKMVFVAILCSSPVVVPRSAVNALFADLGATRHPIESFLVPFNELDVDVNERWWVFMPEAEPCSAGEESDAIARTAAYAHALQFVRPGDKVLDLNVDYCDGVSLLVGMTRAAFVNVVLSDSAADPTALIELPQAGREVRYAITRSIPPSLPAQDFLFSTCDDGLGCLELDQLAALSCRLSAGGRLFLQCRGLTRMDAVDRDVDGSSILEFIQACLQRAGLMLEGAWVQRNARVNAEGGARKLVRLSAGASELSADDYLLILASTFPFECTQDDADAPAALPNIIAFERDYQFPSLVRSMVAVGYRVQSQSLLAEIAERTLQITAENSADAGAALCVKAYLALATLRRGGGADARADALVLLDEVEGYVQKEHGTPTGFRWRVSNGFVAALLWQALGKMDNARLLLQWVAGEDPLLFSPLLGTKTVGAAVLLGKIDFFAGDLDGARRWWRHALTEVQRLLQSLPWAEVVGDMDAPETFGLPELAVVLQQAGVAASGLRALAESAAINGPHAAWKMINSSAADQLGDSLLVGELLQQALEQADESRTWLADRYAEHKDWIASLELSKQWLDGQFRSLSGEVESQSAELMALREHLGSLTESRISLEQHATSLAAALEQQSGVVAELRASEEVAAGSIKLLESKAGSLYEELAKRDATIEELNTYLQELDAGRAWLEGQVSSLYAELENRGVMVEGLQTYVQELRSGKDWLESQVSSLERELDVRAKVIDELSVDRPDIQNARVWFESQVAALLAEISKLEGTVTGVGRHQVGRGAGDELSVAEHPHDELSSRGEAFERLVDGQAAMELSNVSLQAKISELLAALSGLRDVITQTRSCDRDLESGKMWLESQVESLNLELASRGEIIDSMVIRQRELESGKAWLEAHSDSLRLELVNAMGVIQEQESAQSQLLQGKVWLETQVQNLRAELVNHDRTIQELVSERAVLQSDKVWLESQMESLSVELDARGATVRKLIEYQTELEAGKEWLETQLGAYIAECTKRDDLVKSLSGGLKMLTAAQKLADEERLSFADEVEQLRCAWHQARTEADAGEVDRQRLAESVDWLSAQVTSWRHQAEHEGGQRESLRQALEKLVAEVSDGQREREIAERWLSEQVENWREEATKSRKVAEDMKSLLENAQMSWRNLAAEFDQVRKRQADMEKSLWIRIGKRFRFVRSRGAE